MPHLVVPSAHLFVLFVADWHENQKRQKEDRIKQENEAKEQKEKAEYERLKNKFGN